ncbi:MAG: 2-oxoacid:acceptor oxidoreductase family protein [Thermoguttaceae bacterium]
MLLRTTTRVCHSKTVLVSDGVAGLRRQPHFQRDISGRVMIPANARPAHRRLREKLARLAEWSEASTLNRIVEGDGRLGIITSGVAFMHVREAAPEASVLKLGLSYPLPLKKIARFAAGVQRCVVIEEGDPYLVEQLRAAGIAVEGKAEMYRFGELDVARVRRILAGDCTPEPPPARGNPPALCTGCPHRATFAVLKRLDCIVAGDIGCYSLGVLPPLEAMDTLVCMGASIGVGLGLRHVLPNEQARRVVSVIGDSTFVHSGITGLVEMVYNRPATGHVVLILDNGTTAMTGLQEHPGTGRSLGHQPAAKIVYEDLARALGVGRVFVVDPLAQPEEFERLLQESLAGSELTVIIVRRTCLLAAGKIKRYAAACADGKGASDEVRSKMEALPESPAKGERTGATVGLPNRVLCTAGQASSGTKAVASCAKPVTNVIIAGLGGQGVLTASDILAEAAFAAGLDVKKADVHGMSQRGGSVRSDVRFGAEVLSPMVPPGEAHFLVVLSDGQSDTHRAMLRADGRLIDAQAIGRAALPNRRSLNVALLGLLSRHLEIEPDIWQEAIRRNLKAEWHDDNLRAFHMGREAKREGLGIRD